MKSSLRAWTIRRLATTNDMRQTVIEYEFVYKVERRAQVELANSEDVWVLIDKLTADDDLWLNVVDAICSLLYPNSLKIKELEEILRESGSAWTIGKNAGVPGLESRVDEAVRKLAETEMREKGSAGDHLRAAWTASYGAKPDATSSLASAVKAVEAAAHLSICPTDTLATLGKMNSQIRSKPEKWVAPALTTSRVDGVSLVLSMMETLWTDNPRHGSGLEEAAQIVPLDRAQASLELAIMLVRWFRNGTIRPAEP